jgi:Tfp pilus assembly protein PilF
MLYFAHSLLPEDAKLDELLLALVRLPWFRNGSLPDWLRERLIKQLNRDREAHVRHALEDLLLTLLEHPDNGIDLEIVQLQRNEISEKAGLWQRIKSGFNRRRQLRKLYRRLPKEPEGSPFRDYVFLSVLLGIKPTKLAVSVPEILRRILFPQGLSPLGLRPATALLATLLISLGVWVTIDSLYRPNKDAVGRGETILTRDVITDSLDEPNKAAIYRVRVTVLNPQQTPVEDAKLWSSLDGDLKKVAGGWEFDIPGASLPANSQLALFASQENLSLSGMTELTLGNDLNPAVVINLTSSASGEVRGRAVDSSAHAVVGARISVDGYESEAVITSEDGLFRLPAHVGLGQPVKLLAAKPGYQSLSIFAIAGDSPVTLMFTLEGSQAGTGTRPDSRRTTPSLLPSLDSSERIGRQGPAPSTDTLSERTTPDTVGNRSLNSDPKLESSEGIKEQPQSRPAGSILKLAEDYRSQNKFSEAEALYQQALDITKKALGVDHPSVAAILYTLADLYRRQAKYSEAEARYQQALAITVKAQGSEHLNTAAILYALADLYRVQVRFSDAELFYKRALAITERALGVNHPDTATILNNLATVYKAQGEYSEAEVLYKRALQIYEKALGTEHLYVATVLENYAKLLQETNRVTEAIILENRAKSIRARTKPPGKK